MHQDLILNRLIARRGKVESRIVGALRSAIDMHGPMTRERAPSRAKRVIGELKAMIREIRKELKAKQQKEVGHDDDSVCA